MATVYVSGIGSTPFAVHRESDSQALAIRAAREAIRESGIDKAEVGEIFVGNFVSGVLTGREVLAGLAADGLGMAGVPATKVEGACASGGMAFRQAVLAVATGRCRAALAIGVEMMTHASTADVTAALNCAMDHQTDARTGLTYPGLFGLVWRAHAEQYGTTREQVAAVSVKNKANGLRNPIASFGADVTLADVASSPAVADPIRRLDCCGIADGAAAVLVTNEDLAGHGRPERIRVLACAQGSGPARISGLSDLLSFPATVITARRAFEEAGLSPRDIDVVELHDCFSIAEIVDSEDLGLIPKGQGGAYVGEGRTWPDGDIPINASGGLLAKGHPVGATGIGQIFEITRQLRGEHPIQVRNPRIGLTHNLGGTGIACTVSILERTDG